MVKKLLPLSKLTHLDVNSNSIYHYAAPTTKEIINVSNLFIDKTIYNKWSKWIGAKGKNRYYKIVWESQLINNNDWRWFLFVDFSSLFLQFLAAKSTENINHRNSDGYTPLHLGCLYDKPECVKALLAAGADANIHSAKRGATSSEFYNPFILSLKWNLDKKILILLFRFDCRLPWIGYQQIGSQRDEERRYTIALEHITCRTSWINNAWLWCECCEFWRENRFACNGRKK